MTFLHPLLLAGASLIVLPIVLHLVMRRRPQRLEFPALRFVQSRHETNRRRLRLRHLLLLALRVAAIALLAMALARPSVRFAGALGSQEEPVAAILAVDTSQRMEYRHENRTRLEVAQEMGLRLLAQLPEGSQIAVLDSRLGKGAFQVDRGAAKHRLERLETVANAQPMTSVAEEGFRLLAESELGRKEIYLFTDLAQPAWPSEASGLRQRAASVPTAGVYVIDVGVPEPVNFALGDLRLSGQVIANRSTLTLDSDLLHQGPGGQRSVEVFVLDANRKPQARDVRMVSVEAGQSQQLQFNLAGLALGTHQGYLQILGEDGLAADDRRYFTVEVQPAWRVLIAAPQPAEERALFLSQALAPTAFRRSGRARFDVVVMPLEQLRQQTLETLRPYAGICLLDPGPLEPAVWKALADYAAEGRGVAAFLGRRATPVEAFQEPAVLDLLPGRLFLQVQPQREWTALAPRDFEHPALARFRTLAGSIPWQEFPVMRYWQFDELVAGAQTIVPYSDGRPALVERGLGKGRVLAMTTPVSDPLNENPWNLLPAGDDWPFLVLVQQMGDYLVGASEQRLNYFAGQPAVLKLDPNASFQSYLLSGPDQIELRLAPRADRDLLEISATDRPGNYRVQAGGLSGGVDRGFSVNLSAEQTQLTRIPEDQLQSLFGRQPRIARDQEQIDRDVSVGRVGRELFPLLIVLVAAVLALEHLLANRFYATDAPATSQSSSLA